MTVAQITNTPSYNGIYIYALILAVHYFYYFHPNELMYMHIYSADITYLCYNYKVYKFYTTVNNKLCMNNHA